MDHYGSVELYAPLVSSKTAKVLAAAGMLMVDTGSDTHSGTEFNIHTF